MISDMNSTSNKRDVNPQGERKGKETERKEKGPLCPAMPGEVMATDLELSLPT